MSGSVEFRGVVADVEEALVEASVFALPSRAEGFPMSVLEAMAYGLPTVAFDCAPGVRTLIEDDRGGILVEPGDTVAFAAVLERLIEDPACAGPWAPRPAPRCCGSTRTPSSPAGTGCSTCSTAICRGRAGASARAGPGGVPNPRWG